MDAISDPANEQIVMMLGSQLGKSELLLNTIGYYIDQQPSPMLMVQPRVEDAKTFSKDRISPMLRDSPCLRGKVSEARRRDSNNTVTHKLFPGGHITLGGANSPAGLAMRPIRVVLADEVDRYPASAGTEGDPLSLAIRRTSTFWNRKIIIVSTPTIDRVSRIAQAFEETDQRRFFVPCPRCKHVQPLWWANVRWDKAEGGRHLAETAAYACEECGVLWNDGERWAAVQLGKWQPTVESPTSNRPGFHLNGLYSPWKRLSEYVTEWVEAQHNPERLKTFINTVLAETYRPHGEAPDWQRLYERREPWSPTRLPHGALFLTAGVDVQKDRIEIRVWAWGRGAQCWLADVRVIQGDPAQAGAWMQLDEILGHSWTHAGGAELRIARMCVDLGYATTEVYAWARRHPGVLVVKGAPDTFRQSIGAPQMAEVVGTKRSRRGVKVWPVGAGFIKEALYGRLRLDQPIDGQPYPPGYVHIPTWAGDDELKQLTAEELVTERTRRGFARQVWNKTRERNEALDCWVYAYAAAAQMGMERFGEAAWSSMEAALSNEVEVEAKANSELKPKAVPAPVAAAPPTRTSSIAASARFLLRAPVIARGMA